MSLSVENRLKYPGLYGKIMRPISNTLFLSRHSEIKKGGGGGRSQCENC